MSFLFKLSITESRYIARAQQIALNEAMVQTSPLTVLGIEGSANKVRILDNALM